MLHLLHPRAPLKVITRYLKRLGFHYVSKNEQVRPCGLPERAVMSCKANPLSRGSLTPGRAAPGPGKWQQRGSWPAILAPLSHTSKRCGRWLICTAPEGRKKKIYMTSNVCKLPKSAKVSSYSLSPYGSSVETSKSIRIVVLRHGLRVGQALRCLPDLFQGAPCRPFIF